MTHHTFSLLCPSRGRPESFDAMVASVRRTAFHPVEILVYVDVDDDMILRYPKSRASRSGDTILRVGPSNGVGKAWNELAGICTGDYLMMANDDLRFRTDAWDSTIIAAIRAKGYDADGMFVAWANDGSSKADRQCTFPIVSRAWYQALGYFTPECFNFLWHDTWIHDVGVRAGRTVYVPDVLIEHEHFTFRKSPFDDTYKRHRVGPDAQRKRAADEATFLKTHAQREGDAQRIKGMMR